MVMRLEVVKGRRYWFLVWTLEDGDFQVRPFWYKRDALRAKKAMEKKPQVMWDFYWPSGFYFHPIDEIRYLEDME
jgi:hypothetical protein